MTTVRDKIKAIFDDLEVVMNDQKHLDVKDELPNTVMPLVAQASMYWRVLDEEHRDFLNAVRYAIEEGVEWK